MGDRYQRLVSRGSARAPPRIPRQNGWWLIEQQLSGLDKSKRTGPRGASRRQTADPYRVPGRSRSGSAAISACAPAPSRRPHRFILHLGLTPPGAFPVIVRPRLGEAIADRVEAIDQALHVDRPFADTSRTVLASIERVLRQVALDPAAQSLALDILIVPLMIFSNVDWPSRSTSSNFGPTGKNQGNSENLMRLGGKTLGYPVMV